MENSWKNCMFFFISIIFIIMDLTDASQVLSFSVEPQDVTVLEGNSVLLECAGYHKQALTNRMVEPHITWRGPDGQDIGIVGDTFRNKLTNGSLYISSVENNRGLTGSYQCLLSVDNIGTIVSRSAVVSIVQYPELNQNFGEIILQTGQTAYFACVVGQSTPDARAYTVQWHKNDVVLVVDKLRMTLLANGDLEIDEVNFADKGGYMCNVTFHGIFRQSSKTSLDIQGSEVNAYEVHREPMAPWYLIKPISKTVREGDSVTLSCVANGVPKPIIRWLRNGVELDLNDLDSRFAIVGTGSLQISATDETDSGNYQCRASNIIDVLDAGAILQVYMPPKFIQSPQDVTASEKEELELTCAIRGKPEPMVQWLKNGDIITPNEYMKMVAGHNLRLSGLLQTDAGMFQCLGTNPAGSVQAAAQVLITKADKIKPIVVVTQSKSTKTLASKKYGLNRKSNKFHSNEKLSLKSIGGAAKADNIRADNGMKHEQPLNDHDNYESGETFLLTNQDDDVADVSDESVTMASKKKASNDINEKVPGPPQELTAQIVKHSFVTLSWLEPIQNAHDITSYSVFYKNNFSEREQKIVTKSKDELQVNIKALSPSKTYKFRVVANSPHGPGESSKTLEISTQPEENVASPPQNLEVYARSHNEIFVRWQEPKITHGDISKYRVFFSTNDGSVVMYFDTQDEEYLLKELHPNTEYTVNVVAFNGNGMGDTTNEIRVKTLSAIPSEPPNNVSVEVTSSTSLTVHWEPPNEEGRNGQITGYKIRYRKLKEGMQVKSTPANVRFFELTGLDRKSEYQVRLAAMTINGTGPFTEWFRAETLAHDLDESQVPGKPLWVGIQPGADNIALHWGPPFPQEIKIRSYVLGWGKGIPDENTLELKDSERYYVLSNLEPNTEYVVSLRAHNIKGDGPPIYDNIKTREEESIDVAVPLEVPVGLRAITMSTTTIVVYWIDTSLSKNQHVVDNRYYTIRYGGPSSNRYRYLNTTDLNCMIGDLRPGTQYEFSVKVVKGRRESAWSMSVLNSTYVQPAMTAPRDLIVRADEQNAQSALLQWLPPKNSLGQVIGYNVFYTTDSSKRERDWQLEQFTGDETMLIIPNLKPYTTYYFKVQARLQKSNQNSPYSALVTFTTGSAVIMQEPNTVVQSIGGETMLYIIVVTSTCLVLLVILIVSLMCKRKTQTTPDHSKKSYQKNTVGIPKPPDLWINHDQMELKNIDKNIHHSTPLVCSDGASSSGALTLPRSVVNNEYEIETAIQQIPCATNSLDKHSYVAGYMTTSLNSTMERPQYPRTQYSMPMSNRTTNLTIDTGMSQQSLTSSQAAQNAATLMQTPEHPYMGYESSFCPSLYANGHCMGGGGGSINSAISANESSKRGHPLKSFSVPGPPPTVGGLPQLSIHNASVTIRPQNHQSPFKKATTYSTLTPPNTNRIQGVSTLIHSADEIQRLAPSNSTEELNQEMANLEGLMKDLSAITANEFEC